MSVEEAASLGNRISLLSNHDIRYEGHLYGIDQAANTVSLRNVRMLGTEGRRQGEGAVAPSQQVFDMIVFRGGDIRDLTVFETPLADPAIVSVSGATTVAPAAAAAVPAAAAVAPSKDYAGAVRGNAQGGRGFYDEAPAPRRGGYGAGNNNRFGGGGRGGYQRGGYGGRGRGGGHYRRRQEGHTGMDFVVASDKQKEQFKEEFDFEKSREEFERNKKEFEAAKEEAKHHSKAYNKSSFFDTISSDQKDRGATRMDREEMKKADTETFGSEMVGRMHTGGYRRGGRGGRGRYQRY